MNEAVKKIIIIAGPNGAGKTTFARSFLPAEAGLPRFINIPIPVIRRRFAAGLQNFMQHYRCMVSDWALYNNAGNAPVLLEWGENL